MDVTNLAQATFATRPDIQHASTTSAALNTENTQNAATNTAAVDQLSLSSSRSVIVQQVVTQQVEISLNIKTITGTTAEAPQQTDSLVNKVLQKIDEDDATEKPEASSDEDHHANVISNIRVQLQQGFDRAVGVLDQLGVLDQTAVNDVAQTRSQLDRAIDQVAATSEQTPADAEATTAPPVTETTAVNAASASRELTSSLQLTTKDGDIVTVDLSRTQSLTSGGIETSVGSLAFAGAASSSQLSLSIQGELNDKESEAIEKIVQRVNKLAEKLFDGNTGAALGKLHTLKIDSKQLVGLSLNMSSSISYAAVSAYSQVSNLAVDPAADDATAAGNTSGSATGSTNGTVQQEAGTPVTDQASTAQQQSEPAAVTAVQAVQDTAAVVGDVVESDSLKNPFMEIRKLFAQIADSISAFSQNSISSDQNDFIKQLFNDVVDKLESDDHGHDDNDDEATELVSDDD